MGRGARGSRAGPLGAASCRGASAEAGRERWPGSAGLGTQRLAGSAAAAAAAVLRSASRLPLQRARGVLDPSSRPHLPALYSVGGSKCFLRHRLSPACLRSDGLLVCVALLPQAVLFCCLSALLSCSSGGARPSLQSKAVLLPNSCFGLCALALSDVDVLRWQFRGMLLASAMLIIFRNGVLAE